MTVTLFGSGSSTLCWTPGTDTLVWPNGRRYHQFPYIPTKIILLSCGGRVFLTDRQIFSKRLNFVSFDHDVPEVETGWIQAVGDGHKIFLWAGNRLDVFEYQGTAMISKSTIALREGDRIVAIRDNKNKPYIVAKTAKGYRLYRHLLDPHPWKLPKGIEEPHIGLCRRRVKRKSDGTLEVERDHVYVAIRFDVHTRILILENGGVIFDYDWIGRFKPYYFRWVPNRTAIRTVLTLHLELPWELLELIIRYSIPKITGKILSKTRLLPKA